MQPVIALGSQHDEQPSGASAVRWLIGISVAIYFVQLTVLSAADVRAQLGFQVGNLDAWWTVFTYAFVDAGLWHLALNMYALWLFGSRVEARWGSGQFVGYYLLCALGGWGCYMLFARQGMLYGSTAAVMGVALAYARLAPHETLMAFGVVPLTTRWFLALFVVASMLSGIGADTAGGMTYLSHLGGLAIGWAYLRMAGSMDIERFRRRVAQIADEPDDAPARAIPPRSMPRQRDREAREVDEIVQQSQAAIAERQSDVRAAPPVATLSANELNSLLDKISAKGLGALTQSERDRLEAAARKLRDQ